MNYAALTAALIAFTENASTEFAAQTDTFIQLAELRIVREVDLNVFRKYATGAIAAGSAFLAMPTDLVVIRSLAYRATGAANTMLLQKDPSFFTDFWTDRTTTAAAPRFYGRWDASTVVVAPTPATGLTFELAYTYRPPSIVTATTSWLGDNAFDALLAAAMIESLTFEKAEGQEIGPGGPTSQAGIWEAKYAAALNRLKVENARSRVDEYRSGEIR